MVAVTRALAPVLAAIALMGAVAWGPGAVADGPEVLLSSTQARVGETLTISGRGWPQGRELTVSVCQDSGGSNTLTCAPASRLGVVVSWDGYFTTELTVETPEGGCPCVVAVDTPSDPPVTRPLRITRADGESVAAPTGLVVEEARLVGGQGLRSWFGGAATPDLELRLHNGGSSPAELSIRVLWRDGLEEPVSVPVREVTELGPGQTRTVVVPVRFRSWSQGGHTVEGTVITAETIVPFTTETTVIPWGLYAVVAAGLAAAAGWRSRWLFTPSLPRRGKDEEEDLEAQALSLIDRAVSSAPPPRIPRQAARTSEVEREPAWVPMDPAEMIERSTVSVPRQRGGSAGGRRAARTSLKDRVGSIRRR